MGGGKDESGWEHTIRKNQKKTSQHRRLSVRCASKLVIASKKPMRRQSWKTYKNKQIWREGRGGWMANIQQKAAHAKYLLRGLRRG